jgi:hypothetical protein
MMFVPRVVVVGGLTTDCGWTKKYAASSSNRFDERLGDRVESICDRFSYLSEVGL